MALFYESFKHDPSCIDELLGPKARAMGCHCPCEKCQEKEAHEVKLRPVPRNGKMAAAHDLENE